MFFGEKRNPTSLPLPTKEAVRLFVCMYVSRIIHNKEQLSTNFGRNKDPNKVALVSCWNAQCKKKNI